MILDHGRSEWIGSISSSRKWNILFLNGALIAISAVNRRSNCEAAVAAITSESSIKSNTAWSVFTIIVLLCYLAAVLPLLYIGLENKRKKIRRAGIYLSNTGEMFLFVLDKGSFAYSTNKQALIFFLPTATSLNYIFPDDNARA